jgi:fatty-acyl-CoA synthase
MEAITPAGARIARAYERRTGEPFIKIIAPDGRRRTFTYQAFAKIAGLGAALLAKKGLRPGGRVLICMPHQASLFIAMYAVFYRGGIPVLMPPPNPKMRSEDYAEMMARLERELEPDLIVANDEYLGRFIGAGSTIVPASEIADVAGRDYPDLHVISEHDTVFIQYSSGTTGLKKGVEISQGALLEQIDAYRRAIGFDETSVVCNWLPMYHDMGLVCCFWLPLLTGARVTHMSNFNWLSSPEIFLASIESEAATHVWLPNFALSYMARWYNSTRHGVFDLSSLKMITNCSEPVTAGAQEAFIEAFAGCGITRRQLHSCFAMAETTFAITTTTGRAGQRVVDVDPGSLIIGGEVRPGARRLVCSGVPITGTRVRISSDSEAALPENRFGRIQTSSPSLASRYFKDRVDLSSNISDGFFNTGDLGFLQDDHLFVVGREDDMIVAHGVNHDPAAIEESMIDLEGVIPGRVAVFGAPVRDAATNDVVVLCESRFTRQTETEALEARIKQHILARFNFLPAIVRAQASGSLVKSSSGKMARSVIRREFLQESARPEQAVYGRAGGLRGKLVAFMEQRLGISELQASSHGLLSEGLIDSLGAVEICLFLEEQTGQEIPLPNEVGFDHFQSLDNIETLISRLELGEISRRDLLAVGNDLVDRKIRTIKNAANLYNCFFLSSSNLKSLPTAELNSEGREYFNFFYGGASLPDFLSVLGFLVETVLGPIDTVIISLDVERVAGFLGTPAAATVSNEALRHAFETRVAVIDQQAYEARFPASRKGLLQDRLLFGDYAEDYVEMAQNNGDLRFMRAGADIDAFDFRASSLGSDLTAMKMRLKRSGEQPLVALRSMVSLLRGVTDGAVRRVVFVLPPYHPDCFAAISVDPDYKAETRRVLEVIDTVFEGTAEILDHRDIRGFGGDPTDFRDATHAGPRNAKLLARVLREQLYTRR